MASSGAKPVAVSRCRARCRPASSVRSRAQGVVHLGGGDRLADVLVAGRCGEHTPATRPSAARTARPSYPAAPASQLEHQTLDLPVPVDVAPDRVDRTSDGARRTSSGPPCGCPGRRRCAAVRRLADERERGSGRVGTERIARSRSGSNSTVVASAEPPTAERTSGRPSGDDVRVRRRSRRRRRAEPSWITSHAGPITWTVLRRPPPPRPASSWWGRDGSAAGADAGEHVGNPNRLEQATDLREQRRRLRQRRRASTTAEPDLARDRRERAVHEVQGENQIARSDATTATAEPATESACRASTTPGACADAEEPPGPRCRARRPRAGPAPRSPLGRWGRRPRRRSAAQQGARDQTDQQPADQACSVKPRR